MDSYEGGQGATGGESTLSVGRLEDFPEEATSNLYRMIRSCQTGKQGCR